MATLDDQIRETVNRLLESLRGQLESTVTSHQDDLLNAAREEHANRDREARDAEDTRLRLAGEIEDLHKRVDERQSAFEDSQRQLDEVRQGLARASEDAVVARAESVTTRDELTAARDETLAARAEIATLQNQLDTLRHQFDASREEAGARLAQSERLPAAIRSLDASVSFGAVLETLARHAAQEAGRAAVFLLKGDRLREWHCIGFDRRSDAGSLDIAVRDSGLIAEAVQSGSAVSPASPHVVPEFARTDDGRAVSAWPITVGGSVAAVLYADAPIADNPNEPYWPAFLEVLSRHAGRVLEGLTIRHAAGLLTGPAAAISPAVRRQASGSIQ